MLDPTIEFLVNGVGKLMLAWVSGHPISQNMLGRA